MKGMVRFFLGQVEAVLLQGGTMEDSNASEEVDREVRESIRVMNHERGTKKWLVLGGMVIALVLFCVAIFVAYGDAH